jgi:predicted Zn-ribbon and HTH transcriptional regulator
MKQKPLKEHLQTLRQQIIDHLQEQELTVREISQQLGIREKEVYEHLTHIGRSASRQGLQLIVRPWSCLGCGYVFSDRKRLTRPSRCPKCKNSHLTAARYTIG